MQSHCRKNKITKELEQVTLPPPTPPDRPPKFQRIDDPNTLFQEEKKSNKIYESKVTTKTTCDLTRVLTKEEVRAKRKELSRIPFKIVNIVKSRNLLLSQPNTEPEKVYLITARNLLFSQPREPEENRSFIPTMGKF